MIPLEKIENAKKAEKDEVGVLRLYAAEARYAIHSAISILREQTKGRKVLEAEQELFENWNSAYNFMSYVNTCDAIGHARAAFQVNKKHWTLIKDFRPDGHAFFKDQNGNVAIADCSGYYPDETDDGVLYLERDKPIVRVEKASLVLDGGDTTPLCPVEIEFLANLGKSEN